MTNDLSHKQQELAQLQQQVKLLEAEIATASSTDQWNHGSFYGTYYGMVGFVFGGIAAMVSLLANVVGAPIANRNSLEIIRVYLTFPLGEQALALTSATGGQHVIGDGTILALGCCLYIATGMFLGVAFHWTICRFALKHSLFVKLIWGTVLAVAVWFVNFYGILSWLQPLLFGGNWITDPEVLPAWVALATHLVFGWTMALMAPLGQFEFYRRPTDMVTS